MDDPRTYYWNLLLVHPLERALTFLTTDLGLGAGLAIIVFTILMRVVLLPLTIQQFRSQKAMQKLQPELKELQKKHGKDREKLQAETMALYKEHGVNPAAGCFPLVVQMPILFALYAALINLATTNPAFQEPWMWIPNLAHPDVILIAGISIPFILPILTAATQWVQQRMMTQPTDDPQQKMQNSIMQFMPLMMLYFGTTIAAGRGAVLADPEPGRYRPAVLPDGLGLAAPQPKRASPTSGIPAPGRAGITSERAAAAASRTGNGRARPRPAQSLAHGAPQRSPGWRGHGAAGRRGGRVANGSTTGGARSAVTWTSARATQPRGAPPGRRGDLPASRSAPRRSTRPSCGPCSSSAAPGRRWTSRCSTPVVPGACWASGPSRPASG